MKEYINQYLIARKALYEAFNCDWYPEIIDYLADNEWYFNQSDISYLDGNGDEYSFESAQLIGEKDGYVLFNASNNGVTYHAIFHRDKELTEEEAGEKLDWW